MEKIKCDFFWIPYNCLLSNLTFCISLSVFQFFFSRIVVAIDCTAQLAVCATVLEQQRRTEIWDNIHFIHI